jgi:hypothetical protein
VVPPHRIFEGVGVSVCWSGPVTGGPWDRSPWGPRDHAGVKAGLAAPKREPIRALVVGRAS